MSVNFLNIFGEEEDSDECIISIKKPNVKVNSIVKNEVDIMLRTVGISDDKCFRVLISNLITSSEDWENGNYKTLNSKYSSEIEAAYGNRQTLSEYTYN